MAVQAGVDVAGAVTPNDTRTTSRTESIPTTSEPSQTTRWRNPPETIAAAASSSDHSGDAATMSSVRWAPDLFGVEILAGAHGIEDVTLGDDAGLSPIGVHDDGSTDLALDISPRGIAQRVGGTDREDDSRHGVTYSHDGLPGSADVPDHGTRCIQPCGSAARPCCRSTSEVRSVSATGVSAGIASSPPCQRSVPTEVMTAAVPQAKTSVM